MVTGSRRGEVSALRWRHVDFDGSLLTLHRSNAQPRSGLKEKETKSRQQRRVLLDPETVELLTAHRDVCEKRCAALDIAFDPDAFLFSPMPDGSAPWPPRSLTLRYGRLARKLKLRSTRLHSLRHYSATELIAAGTDIRTVAGRLGHGSGGATTLKIYAAWVDEAGQRAASTMAGIMPTIAVQRRGRHAAPTRSSPRTYANRSATVGSHSEASCPQPASWPPPTASRSPPPTAPSPSSTPKASSRSPAAAAPW
jgi:hypothetical protein